MNSRNRSSFGNGNEKKWKKQENRKKIMEKNKKMEKQEKRKKMIEKWKKMEKNEKIEKKKKAKKTHTIPENRKK